MATKSPFGIHENYFHEVFVRADCDVLYSDDHEVLLQYERQIRNEFRAVPDHMYKAGRIQFINQAIEFTSNQELNIIIEVLNMK